jgi:hypothetical protein
MNYQKLYMRYLLLPLAVCFIFPPSMGNATIPRSPRPQTPDAVWRNDVDLSDAIEDVPFLRENSPAQLTANQNDYDIGDRVLVLRMSSDASRTITGFQGGKRGRWFLLINVGAQNIVLANQSVSSVAANRILTGTGASLTIAGDNAVQMYYDSTTARWRVILD